MTIENIGWGGQRDGESGAGELGEPTEAETAFATSLNALVPGLDYWLHADDDGTPWLLVSLDLRDGPVIQGTLRLDFDVCGIRGGWSPSCLNWDDGVRAEEALIDLTGPDGLDFAADGSSVEDLARRAAEWFTMPKTGRWADHSGS